MTKINRPENLFEGFNPTHYNTETQKNWPQQWEQAEVDAAYQAICRMWTPTAAAFKNLGQMYADARLS